jgi:hypothetical protein
MKRAHRLGWLHAVHRHTQGMSDEERDESQQCGGVVRDCGTETSRV